MSIDQVTTRTRFAEAMLERGGTSRLELAGGRTETLADRIGRGSDGAAARLAPGRIVIVRDADPLRFVGALLAVWMQDAVPMVVDHRVSDVAMQEVTRVTRAGVVFADGTFSETGVGSNSARAVAEGDLMLQLTSGTTGRFRIVRRDTASVVRELDCYAAMPYLAPSVRRVTLGSSPFHTFGLVGGVLAGLWTAKDVRFARQLTVDELDPATAAVTALLTVPSVLQLLVRYRDGLLLDDLAGVLFAGERLTGSHASTLPEVTPHPVNIFGTTETGLLANSVARGDLRYLAPSGTRRLEVHADALVVGMDASPYLVDRAGGWADGEFATGDRVASDGDGRFEILGRFDSQVSVAGRKVNLSRVEDAAVATGFAEAAVARLADRVQLFVQLVDNARPEAFEAALRSALEPVEQPARVFVVDELPRTYGGKLVRDPRLLDAIADGTAVR